MPIKHTVVTLNGGEVFLTGTTRRTRKLSAERGLGFEDVVFQESSVAICSTFWNTRTPAVTLASTSSSSGARATCALIPYVEDEHTVVLEDNHPEPEGDEAVPR